MEISEKKVEGALNGLVFRLEHLTTNNFGILLHNILGLSLLLSVDTGPATCNKTATGFCSAAPSAFIKFRLSAGTASVQIKGE